MNSNFTISSRLLFATLFGIIIIGTALYMRNNNPNDTQITKDTTNKDQVSEQIKQVTKPVKQSTTTQIYTEVLGQSSGSAMRTNSTSTIKASTNTKEQNNTTQEELTETDILTRNVIGPYIKQNNTDSYTKTSGEKIIKDATKYLFTLNYAPKTLQDIQETTDVSKESVLTYKQELYTALKPLFELKEYELTIYAQAVKDNDAELFDSLGRIADIYEQAGDDVLALKAPRDVNAVHLSIVNSLYKFTTVLREMTKGFNDPAGSLSGTGNFSSVEEEFGQAFTRLNTYFIIKGANTPIK